MDRGNNKKRGARESEDPSKKRKKKKIEAETVPAAVVDPFLLDETDAFKIEASPSSHHRPLSIFEFPWQMTTIETDHGCDLRDVFFSSLVDGCKAAIGFPGDRLSPSPAPISLPEETDGVDCIWSCVLREPLSLRCVQ